MVSDHDVLHQVGGGVGVAQVAQAVAPHARREQPVELGLGLAAPRPGAAAAMRRASRASGVSAAAGVGGFHGASIAKRRRRKKSL